MPHKHRLAAAVLAVLLFASACGSGAGDPAASACPSASKTPVTFADTQFQTLWINNAIAQYIMEHGYCTPAKSITMSTPIMQKSVTSGQVDVMMELWRVNIINWYNQSIKSGKLVDLGNTYNSSTQGWYVPRYVIYGDPARGIKAMAPNLKSVADLKQYWQVFKDPNDPSKGLLVNCIGAWQCNKVNRIKLQAYGLTKYFNTEDPGTPSALDAAIVGAYKKGQPVLAYYWGPTWLLGQYDMVQLKEPAYTPACNAEIQKILSGSAPVSQTPATAGCAYQAFAIHKGANGAWAKANPTLVAFLKKMNVGNADLDKTAAYMQTQHASAAQAAVYYLKHFSSRWESWVPAPVAARIRKSLGQGA